ncbi:MAG: glutamine-hydrolyzing carbamoyl-phosphate synthase small subunit [Candidatus Caenarcaniphilales bacterium]|jgi:carbamoyl-phosphate synthase small subunit|nr:glutamine-hydrolyzing carbamoyl-phosphate synthase small subunit [Candidatus Caenarcaniphilales bacterium]
MARLVLEDGREFKGKHLGAKLDTIGELVFNTAMTGYQETITDPSYAGQIITFTYPEIGNYGCNDNDLEASNVKAKGIVLKNYTEAYSNYRATESLNDFLVKNSLAAIYEVDTRAITKHIRDKGAMKALITTDEKSSVDELLTRINQYESMTGLDLASRVTCQEPYMAKPSKAMLELNPGFKAKNKFSVIAFDFGIKTTILDRLIYHGAEVEVVPANTPAEYILKRNPDAVFLSNGPGDPAAVTYAITTIKTLVERFHKPIFGICLGHQLLALASGAKTYKLKFGHRGANQPIKNLVTGKIEIASHNHGFAVSFDDLPDNLEVTHLNINDNTIAGIRLKNRKDVFSVQYHPEASPGPHDSDYLFREFLS